MAKTFLLIGTLLSGLSVMIGAFGAHALRATLTASGRTETFETAVKYQFYHALALIMLGLFLSRYEGKIFENAGFCLLSGTCIFSGSLYILCLSNVTKWGAVTPVGGLLMIIGWVLWLVGIWKNL